MQAWLHAQGAWHIVAAVSLAPKLPASSAVASEAQIATLDAWELKSDKACGWMYLSIKDDQKIHLKGIEGDPVKIWAALSAIHLQKRPGMHFNAYDDLFSIRKQKDETLQTLINRVDTSIRHIQDLCPADFDLAKLDDELASMAMIRALPEEYSNFASSLLLMDKLDKASSQQAFVSEESQCRHHASEAPAVASALAASFASAALLKCLFCLMTGHVMEKCHRFFKMQQDAQQSVKNNRAKGRKANKVQEAKVEEVVEFVGNASACSSLSDSSTPQNNSDFDWLADTGAISYMTPHRQWLRKYTSMRIPIKLADDTIVYSAGVGTGL